jgi:hypothetical protein
MNEHGVTWGDVEACKVGFDAGLLPMLRGQWEAQGDLRTPSVKDLGLSQDAPPIATLFTLLSCGLYPPPELLAALLQGFHEYLEGEGTVSLEVAFFGKPPKRAGNYARRRKQAERNLKMAVDYGLQRKKPKGERGAPSAAERAAAHQITGHSLTRIIGEQPSLKAILDNEELLQLAARALAPGKPPPSRAK